MKKHLRRLGNALCATGIAALAVEAFMPAYGYWHAGPNALAWALVTAAIMLVIGAWILHLSQPRPGFKRI